MTVQPKTKEQCPHITDHALLRYMERVHDIPVDHYRGMMDKPGLKEALQLKPTTIIIDGIKFIVRNCRIVTVWNPERHGKYYHGKGSPNKKRKRNQHGKGPRKGR